MASEIKTTNTHGGSATTGKRRWSVYVRGELLRDKRGVGRRFASQDAAETAGHIALVTLNIQARYAGSK